MAQIKVILVLIGWKTVYGGRTIAAQAPSYLFAKHVYTTAPKGDQRHYSGGYQPENAISSDVVLLVVLLNLGCWLVCILSLCSTSLYYLKGCVCGGSRNR